MKIFTLSFLLILFGLAFQQANACSCAGPQTFCETIGGTASSDLLIVLGEKISDKDHGMKVRIRTVIRGREDRKVITVWGDPGHLCRVYTSEFEAGALYVFAFHPITVESPDPREWQAKEKIGHYSISVCGRYFWKCDGASWQTETAEDLKRCLGVDPCSPDGLNLTVFPNPVNSQLMVTLPIQADSLQGTGTIYDLQGRAVRQYAWVEEDFAGGELRFQVEGLPAGMYMIRLEVPELTSLSFVSKFQKR